MELELQHQTLEGFRPVYHADFGQEETLESIIPDSFPDVARIVSASGKAFLKDKETGEGSLRLTGLACITVLYIPEGEDQVRALEVSIPFQSVRDCPQVHNGIPVHGVVSVTSADARMMNPRKLLVRCSLMCRATAYDKDRRELTCDAAGNDICLEKQFRKYDCHTVSEITEKAFLFSDVLRQTASKPAMEELLFYRAEIGTLDGKVIGKKLVCKGDILLSVLYRGGGTVIPVRFELPYSQIAELSEEYHEGEAEVALAIKTVDCRLRDGELEVSVEGLLQSCIWVQKSVTLLSDVYCTSCSLDAERTRQSVCTMAEQGKRREQVRQFCPSGIPGKQVLDCCAMAESISAESGTCSVRFNVDILYLSEDDALCGVNYSVDSSCEIPVMDHCGCRWSCRPMGEVTAVPVTGGLEVRFDAEFSWVQTREETPSCVTALKRGIEDTSGLPRPSVVIRRVGENESLWEIAKTCGATVRDICRANGLAAEAAPGGAILLIPAKRA